MRYLVRACFDGQVRYFYVDNQRDAQYLFDLICNDLVNGVVEVWSGDELLNHKEKYR